MEQLNKKTMHDTTVFTTWLKAWEGGYANVPGDSGGPTNMGITLASLQSAYGKDKTAADLKRISDRQWDTIFRRGYWDRWRADDIRDSSVAFALVDWLWCSGAYGIKIPQRVLGVDIDGIVGPKTLSAINSRNGRTLFDLLKQERLAYLERICITRPANKKFLKGWLRRVNSLNYRELSLPSAVAKILAF